MPWHDLDTFRDASVPKLFNLRRADRAGLLVPRTYWALARDLEADGPSGWPDLPGLTLPCIVRSGSPTEDTAATSNAGRFASVIVRRPLEFPLAVDAVIASLPAEGGRRLGAVFVQPLVEAELAGVTFFDGFYYEEASAPGTNAGITSGRERGDVRRGQVERGEPRSVWLGRVHRVFGGPLDLEWAQPARGDRVVLQVRPALFPIRRNPILSLANHKEILGDPPSPWATGLFVEAGRRAFDYFAEVEPAVADWDEPYAYEVAERPWMNFSAFFRLHDRWGLPRSLVTDGIGGESAGPADGKVHLARLARRFPTIVRMALANLDTMSPRRIGAGLGRLDARIEAAGTLADLQRAHVEAQEFSLRTNFAILQVLSIAARLRRLFGFDRAARVVTHDMMTEYAELASRAELADRLVGLDAWLARFGHRGPLETDPIRPRFAEMRDELEADLRRGPAPPPRDGRRPSSPLAAMSRLLFFWPDEIRERYRDQMMRRWRRIRERVLAEAGRAVAAGALDRVEDAFFLRSADLAADPSTWRGRVRLRRAAWERASALELPTTADRDTLQSLAERDGNRFRPARPDRFRGIGLGAEPVVGTAVRAWDLAELLDGRALPENPVLIAPTLEPSWAIVFPRFAAVVAELGGEASHAAILLREAGIPSVVNARGVCNAVADGDRLRVDPARGEVAVEARASAAKPHATVVAGILNKAS